MILAYLYSTLPDNELDVIVNEILVYFLNILDTE